MAHFVCGEWVFPRKMRWKGTEIECVCVWVVGLSPFRKYICTYMRWNFQFHKPGNAFEIPVFPRLANVFFLQRIKSKRAESHGKTWQKLPIRLNLFQPERQWEEEMEMEMEMAKKTRTWLTWSSLSHLVLRFRRLGNNNFEITNSQNVREIMRNVCTLVWTPLPRPPQRPCSRTASSSSFWNSVALVYLCIFASFSCHLPLLLLLKKLCRA